LKALIHNLSTRLIFAFVVAILITAVAASVPTYWVIRNELERSTWDHVLDGGQVTQALLKNEQDRMAILATLASQRLTSQRLMQKGASVALHDFVRTFKTRVDLDVLVVCDASGKFLAEIGPSFECPALLSDQDVTFRVLPGSDPKLVLLASQPIQEELSNHLLGYVMMGVFLDDEFSRGMAVGTGFDQSFIIEKRRIASSMAGVPLTVDQKALDLFISSRQQEKAVAMLNAGRYYTALFPIFGSEDEVVALGEVALHVDELISAEHRVLLALNISAFLVIVIGSAIGSLYAQRLTAPLSQLTISATKIGQGDLETPVPCPDDPIEITTLAKALEESRINTQHVLKNLSRAKDWSETLIQSIAEGIVTIDDSGCITSFSQGAERITGWLRDEVLHQQLDEVFPLSNGDGKFSEHIPPYGGKRQISVLNRSGRNMTLAITDAPLVAPNSDTNQTALVLRDITEEEAVQELRSYFLANITHEFRTPLAALNASVEFLLGEIDQLSKSEIGQLLGSIHFSVTGLQTLIDNLLESINIEAGHFTIRLRSVDLMEIVVEAVEVMRPLLNRRHQHLSISKPDMLPMVKGDPTRLKQVMVNLLSNASKYGPLEQKIEISIDSENEERVRVSVADAGPGIPLEERDKLFQPFVRLSAADGAQYGVGLGLSVAKAIVKEHGGEVDYEKRPGAGSIFWFTIPRQVKGHESSYR
jgi:PAS domain S-box-containing protein